jgi:inorganic pyrophosphatase
MQPETFWSKLDALVDACPLVIDRPKSSLHPRHRFAYPLDYGYLDGTRSGDGEGIDVWVGSVPERGVTAVICTVDVGQRDAELKILPGCTLGETQAALATHNAGAQAGILVQRTLPLDR